MYNNCLFEGSPYKAARAWILQHGLECLRFIKSFLALDSPISLCLILRSEYYSQTQALEDFDHTASTAEKQLQGVSSVSRNALPLAPRGLADMISPLSVLVKVKHQAHPPYTSPTQSESSQQQKKEQKQNPSRGAGDSNSGSLITTPLGPESLSISCKPSAGAIAKGSDSQSDSRFPAGRLSGIS